MGLAAGCSDGAHRNLQKEVGMADDIEGKAKHVGGKLKEGVGDLLGDRKIKEEGRLDQMEGRAEQDVARAQDAVLDAEARRLAAKRAKGETP
jgi:uncharacterized protein YjbJ (UPF0337 family)